MQITKDIELKPCPWCGETEKKKILHLGLSGCYFIDHYDPVFHLQSSVGFETEAEAAAAWNKMRTNITTICQSGGNGTIIENVSGTLNIDMR